jgi:hypothetical protein
VKRITAVFSSCIFSIVVCGQGTGLANTNGVFGDFGQHGMQTLTNGYSINSFNSPENTKGRRYFFDEWVKGYVIANSGKQLGGDEYFFNFDKVNNNLMVTKDKKEIIEVNKDSLKEIHFTEKGLSYEFVKEPKITAYKFVEVLQKSDKLSLYKTINTRLVKANFTTDGLTESGNPYDEYVDAPTYILCYNGEFRPVILRFRSIKSALKEESKKVNQYYEDHLYDEVDENYLKNLVIYINQ